MANFGITMESLNLNSVSVPSVTNTGQSQVSGATPNKNSRQPVYVDPEKMESFLSANSSVTPSESASNNGKHKQNIAQAAVNCNPDSNNCDNMAGPVPQNWGDMMDENDKVNQWMDASMDANGTGPSKPISVPSTRSKPNSKPPSQVNSEPLIPNFPMPVPTRVDAPPQPKKTVGEMFFDESLDNDPKCNCPNCPYKLKYKMLKQKMKQALVDMISEM
ncbi:NSP5 [Rotavirus K]|nr:NSP5 [Rotavirus K]